VATDAGSRVFITGATGFIGSHLVDGLLARGYKAITALGRNRSAIEGLRERGVASIMGDIADETSLRDIKGTFDAIVHCAGVVGNQSIRSLYDVNVRGTANICDWAIKRNVAIFVHLSSVAVNSGNMGNPLTEDMPYSAVNCYGRSKIGAELVVKEFQAAGLPAVIVRPCAAYGPDEPHLLPRLLKCLKARLWCVPALSTAWFHWVSVRNVAACLIRCMEDSKALGGTFNIADEETVSFQDIKRMHRVYLGVSLIPLPPAIAQMLMALPVIRTKVGPFVDGRVYSIKNLNDRLGFTPPYRAVSEIAWTLGALSSRKATHKGA
jgi:nucleoside-diphosphate-sugar epimerase